MGFVHPLHEGMLQSLGLKFDQRGNVAASTDDYRTSIDKVFAAGDMRRGQSLVVWAIREGRQAAHAVDKFLMGSTQLPR
jgi:glutamate synthase (NADPH/NADH) small chain